MEQTRVIRYQKSFLIVVAAILIPIALSYGLAPEISLSFLFGIEEININLKNMLRSVMGLYLAMATFWVVGAFNQSFRRAALLSLIVFMLGVAGGRIISIVFDGIPHWLLIMYTISELVIAAIGLALVRET